MPAAGIAAHEQAADQATTGMFLLGLVAAFGLFRGRGQRSMPGCVLGATAILALVTFALMARIANLGGQLRHEEIRPGVRALSGMSAMQKNRTMKIMATATWSGASWPVLPDDVRAGERRRVPSR